ncbi:Sb-PDE family phosphodiesterase [Maribellus comscasis]|nr:Sb-PDE family phosphodiesterase [Maribellus comscasis]
MKAFKILLLLLAWCSVMDGYSQVEALHHNQLILPDKIGDKLLLKGDFHMHTAYSDGHVMPDYRAFEAINDGMNLIALTEHIDFELYPDELHNDYNKPYEMAKAYAQQAGYSSPKDSLIVVLGAEISPRVSPFHCNAVFLKDANAIPAEYMSETKKKFIMKQGELTGLIYKAFYEAKKQGAFIFYNHPGYKYWDYNKYGVDLFTDIHEDLLEKGLINGIEIVNSGKYFVEAHRIAIEKGLTVFANSDAHWGTLRTMGTTARCATLVLADNKSDDAIKQALFDKQTAAYWDNHLAGSKEILTKIFRAGIEIKSEKGKAADAELVVVTIVNNTSIPFVIGEIDLKYDLLFQPKNSVVLAANSETVLKIKTLLDKHEKIDIGLTILNALVAPGQPLKTNISVEGF